MNVTLADNPKPNLDSLGDLLPGQVEEKFYSLSDFDLWSLVASAKMGFLDKHRHTTWYTSAKLHRIIRSNNTLHPGAKELIAEILNYPQSVPREVAIKSQKNRYRANLILKNLTIKLRIAEGQKKPSDEIERLENLIGKFEDIRDNPLSVLIDEETVRRFNVFYY